MVKNKEVAKAWVNGRKLKTQHFYTDGKNIFSYGSHFCVGIKLKNKIVVCFDHHSSSTSKHQSYIKDLVNESDGLNVLKASQEEMQTILKNESDDICILERQVYGNDAEIGFTILENAWKKNVLFHPFPHVKLRSLFNDLVAEKSAKEQKSIIGHLNFKTKYSGSPINFIVRRTSKGVVCIRKGWTKGRPIKEIYQSFGYENITERTLSDEIHNKVLQEITLDKI